MDYLYNKIYEAVNTGIQKALIIDPEQDISVRWKEKEISAEFDELSIYVCKFKKLLNTDYLPDDKRDEFIQIVNDMKNLTVKYKVMNFKELKKIDNKLYQCERKQYRDMSWLDLSNVIVLVLNNYQEVSLDNFHGTENDIKYITVKNCECQHDIIFHKDLLISHGIAWCDDYIDEDIFNDSECITNEINQLYYGDYQDNKLNDYDGYNHTYNNVNIKNGNYANYPAFEYCISKSDGNYKGYLPAIDEFWFFVYNLEFINKLISRQLYPDMNWMNQKNVIDIEKYSDQQSYWTSTEKSFDLAVAVIGHYMDLQDKVYDNIEEKCQTDYDDYCGLEPTTFYDGATYFVSNFYVMPMFKKI